MPKNKRESIIYSVMMCFCMVLWMSVYNVSWAQGGSFPSQYPGGVDGYAHRLYRSLMPGYVFGFQTCQRGCLPVLLKAGKQRTDEDHCYFQLYCGAYGYPDVPIWRGRACLPYRTVGNDSLDVALQYSQKFYYGAALPAFTGGSLRASGISAAVPGRDDFRGLIKGFTKLPLCEALILFRNTNFYRTFSDSAEDKNNKDKKE